MHVTEDTVMSKGLLQVNCFPIKETDFEVAESEEEGDTLNVEREPEVVVDGCCN